MNKEELQQILEVLEKFPGVETFELLHNDSSGIGNILNLSFPYVVNGIHSTQLIEISGVDKW